MFVEEYHSTPQSGDGTFGLPPRLVFEQYRTEHRSVDSAAIDILCTKTVGPVKVGRDGVRHRNVLYGGSDQAVWKLQGKEVWLRVDPVRVDFVTVCDESGKPICKAYNKPLRGATQEQRREAAKIKARYRKAVRAYAPARNYLLETDTQQILQAKRDHAKARMEELRKELPAPAAPAGARGREEREGEEKEGKEEERKKAPARSAGKTAEKHDGVERLAAVAEREAGNRKRTSESRLPSWEDVGGRDETTVPPDADRNVWARIGGSSMDSDDPDRSESAGCHGAAEAG